MTMPPAIVTGVSWWNRATLAALLATEPRDVHFRDSFTEGLAAAAANGGPIYAWASKITPDDEAAARAAGVPVTFVEDGFIRSVGLGAGLARGGAFVLDRTGIYYDATRPSDIETMLQTAEIEPAELTRASDLRRRILANRLSKYNVGRHRASLAAPAGRERVLVVGQVSVDAGVRLTRSATIDCNNPHGVNLELLKAARAASPSAYIVYKLHPDVAAGLRPGAIASADVARLADAVIADCDIVDLIEATDRLVTLSSLSGFEALLRGKPVTVHGLPFYAGWGLTDDLTVTPRRTRRLTLDVLIAVTLLRYCRYVDPVTLHPTTAECMIDRLARLRQSPLHRVQARFRQQLSWAGRKLGL
jgi:capsular polysaccharide export protein